MAIFESAAFTKLSKSFGNLTTCFSRGRNILRLKTTTVRNPRTIDQQIQRTRWRELTRLSSAFRPAVQLGFPARPVEETPYNTFVRMNTEVVQVSEELKVTVDYEKLVCSQGNRIVPQMVVEKDVENRRLTFKHTPGSYGPDADPADRIYAAIYEKELNLMELYPLNNRKDTEPAVVTFPTDWKVENMVIYVFVLSANRHIASDTKCIPVA